MKKCVKKSRGLTSIYDDGSITFHPYNEGGPSKQESLVKIGKSSTYVTAGEKQQSRVFHLVVPATDPDPESAAAEVFDRLARKTKPLAVPMFRGKCIYNQGGLQVTVNKSQGRLLIREEIVLSPELSWQDALMSNNIKIFNQCIINKDLIHDACLAQRRISSAS